MIVDTCGLKGCEQPAVYYCEAECGGVCGPHVPSHTLFTEGHRLVPLYEPFTVSEAGRQGWGRARCLVVD